MASGAPKLSSTFHSCPPSQHSKLALNLLPFISTTSRNCKITNKLFISSTPQLGNKMSNSNELIVYRRAKGNSDDESLDEAPVPPKRPPFEWKKWAVGILFFIILPSYRHKMGPFAILKDKVEEMLETAETAAEVVEDLAEFVEKLADEAEKRLPDNTKLDDIARAIENLAERVDEKAEKAQELINEIENIAEDIEEMMEVKILDATNIHGRHDKRLEDQGTRIHRRLPDDTNLKEGAESIEDLTKQAQDKAEETQELIHQVGKLGHDLEEMDSNSPAAKSSSQETEHEDKSVNRLSKV